MKSFLVLVILVLCAGCYVEVEREKYQIKNVTQVMFVHEAHYYVFATDPITKEIEVHNLYIGSKIPVIADVPENEPMWVDVEKGKGGTKYVIHVHSAKELVGGNQGGKHPQQLHALEKVE